jgi:hypothetical protein
MPYFENDYPTVIGENPRAYKVNKQHNGKRSNVATMTGVSRSTLASKPSLRINQNYEIEIDHGYVDLVMLSTATRLNRAILANSSLGLVKEHGSDRYRVRVGRIVNGRFERSRSLSLTQLQLLANAVFIGAKYPSISALIARLSKAVDRAIEIDPKLGLSRDRSDNPRYARPVKPTGDRTVGSDITLVTKTPRPSTVRALEKRQSR